MAVEEINPYGDTDANTHKSEQVEKMFDSIAPAYDFMNTAMTFGLHRIWRNSAIRMLNRQCQLSAPATEILDVACGTGDVSFKLAREFPLSHITGVDLSPGMLQVARKKLGRLTQAGKISSPISFQVADCLNLPFADNTYKAITVAYGVRNFERLLSGYREMHRVLKPGGVLCVIELCEPKNPVMHALYRIYARHIIPLVGKCVSGDKSAYTYLPASIQACPQRQEMLELMHQAGFQKAEYKALFPGTVAVYLGQK